MSEPKKNWWDLVSKNAAIVVFILGGFASAVIFWYKSDARYGEFQSLKELVIKQYSTQREANSAQDKKTEEALDWIEYQKGYMKGKEDGYNDAVRDFKNLK